MKRSIVSCKNNENCKKEVTDAVRFVKKLERPEDIYVVVHFDLEKSTEKMIEDAHETITKMLIHNKICRNVVEKNGGKVIKELGDAVLAVFKNSGLACECAIKVIRNMKKHKKEIITKVTISTGRIEKIKTDHKFDVYGLPVNRCNRMSKFAESNTIIFEEKRIAVIEDYLEDQIKSGDISLSKSKEEKLIDFGATKLRKIIVNMK